MPRVAKLPSLGPELQAIAAVQDHLLTTAQLADGGFDANDLRSLAKHGGWRRVIRGVWAVPLDGVVTEEITPRQRARAGLLAVGGGVACLGTAAGMLGLDGSPWDQRIHISIDPDATRKQAGGVAVHWLVLDPTDVVLVDGMPCTAPHRLVLDAGRRWDREHFVSLVDSSLRHGVLATEVLFDLVDDLPVARRHWLALVDGRAESPLETRVRLLLIDAGLTPEDLQTVLRDELGQVIARLDISWPSVRVAVECDGAGPHGQPNALYRDRTRQDDVNNDGWRIVRVTWEDWQRRPQDVVRRVRRALLAQGASSFVR